jgi:hypothetical protein
MKGYYGSKLFMSRVSAVMSSHPWRPARAM